MIERQENVGDPRDSLASWLRPDGSRRYVPATTLCLHPPKPHRLRARREGCEVVLRCYDCPGCREFEAQRLARRLVETYRSSAAAEASSPTGLCLLRISNKVSRSPRLFALRVYCPKELHVSTARRMRRSRGLEVDTGFVRAGVESFMVVTSSLAELGAWLLRRRLRFDFRPIGDPTRARSWRWFVRGLTVPRSAYGENTKRWYRRGLTPADKLKWEVIKIAEYKSFQRASSARVISKMAGNLVPPRVWTMPRGVSVRIRNLLEGRKTPEAVAHVMPEVRALVARIGKHLDVSARPKTPEELERSRRAYQHVARLEAERTDPPISANSSPPFLKGEVSELLDNSSSQIGRPMSSIHSSGAPPPRTREQIRAEAEAAEAAEKARMDRSDRRNRKRLEEEFAKLRAHMERIIKDSDR